MKCPKCHSEIELSWRRYLAAPFGRFKCPNCNAKFKSGAPLWLKILVPFSQILFIIGCGVLIILFMVGDPIIGKYAKPTVVFISLFSIVLFAVADKHVKSKYPVVSL